MTSTNVSERTPLANITNDGQTCKAPRKLSKRKALGTSVDTGRTLFTEISPDIEDGSNDFNEGDCSVFSREL